VGANIHAKLMNADALPGSAAAASASTALAMEGEAEKKRPSGRMAIRSKGPPGRSSATKLPPVAVPWQPGGASPGLLRDSASTVVWPGICRAWDAADNHRT
jgi:hypothetical protein